MRSYLDHAATTPVRPDVVDAMVAVLTGASGNPSGAHADARQARQAVDDAREQIALIVGADLGEVVFTGGGTEADNLAVAGSLAPFRERGSLGPVVCAAMEHHAVLSACRAAAAHHRIELREVPSDRGGQVDLAALERACTTDVALVSVMAVNNEIGTQQPLAEVAEVVRRRAPASVLHTDAVQAAPWSDLAPVTNLVDLVSISAHKFGGPQGVGALVVRNGTELRPIMHGGGQERDRRSGTSNVAGIVGMATALTSTTEERPETAERVASLRDRLADGVIASVDGVDETGDRGRRVPGIVHLRFAGLESEALVLLLDQRGVSVSAGASCSSGAVGPSHVLSSMGLDRAAASSGVRFSLGVTSTEAEVDAAIASVEDAVAQLRN